MPSALSRKKMNIYRSLLAIAALSGASVAAAEPPLKVVGYSGVMEMAPMLLAAETLPKGSVVVANGGIPSLWAKEVDEGAPEAANNAQLPDLAGNAETQALRQSVKHPDLRIIATVTEGIYRIIAKRSSGITSLADLKGKRITTFGGTSAAFYLGKMLERAGLGEADVTIINTNSTVKSAEMLLAGTADALAVWEPEPERIRLLLGDNAIEFNDFGVYRELYNLNATAATLADPVKRRQTVTFVKAMIAGCQDATYKPARGQAMIAKNTGYDVKLIEATWHHHHFTCGLPIDLLDVMVEEEKWLAAREKRAPRGRTVLSTLIDPTILAEAMAK